MEKEKLFTAPRWNDPPIAKVTGFEEVSEEEQKKAEQEIIDCYFGGKKPDDWRTSDFVFEESQDKK